MDENDFQITPPAFDPQAALQQLRRFLRDQRLLVERGTGFTLQGSTVVELAVDEPVLNLRLAKSPQRSPQWETLALRSMVDLRRAQDEIRKRLQRWTEES